MQGPQALTVSAVVNFLREVLEANEIFSDLWIAGEISNYTRSQLGHRYFSLKDRNATLRTVLFRDTMPGMQLANGDNVLAHGRLTVYPQRGELQFVCDFVRPEGVGILAARFEELTLRLEAEGLFDPGRKRPLPRFPRRIGVVTSPTGAALQDVRKVLSHRWPLAELVVSPAMVQGEHAPGQLVGAMRQLAREPNLDLALLVRGGGAAEDLWAFNDERVARAIFGFPVPLVSGLGHETDETIADFVADVRAPTPSAAAERATPDIREMHRALVVVDRAMASATREAIAGKARAVTAAAGRLNRNAPSPARLAQDVNRQLRELQACLERACAADRARFESIQARIAGLDPRATLARGFAIVQDAKSRKVVTTVKKVKPGARLSVAVTDGAFWTEVS
ncbi:MAG: exodeoxyribonuclease VII large subunit [Hyphomicrobiales bacterium]